MDKRPRALDLFSGAGGATRGLQLAGFHVTGIDNRKQPRYIGDAFIQADALQPPVRLQDFDLVWASPPCQGYSRTRHLPWLKGKVHPLLIHPVRDMLARSGALTVIENVGDAPLQGVALRGGMFGLPFTRLRRFEANFLVMAPARGPEPVQTAGRMFAGRLRDQHNRMSRYERGAGSMRNCEGVEWMHSKEAGQAIPPAYSEHIGRYAMLALGRAEVA